MTDNSSNVEGGIDTERLLLLVFLAGAGIMFYKSFEWGSTAGLFPRITSAIVIVGALLLLLQEYLPSQLNQYVSESTELLGSQEEMGKELEQQFGADEETDDQPSQDEEQANWGMSPSVFTAAVVAGYFVTSLLFGMLWMSPVVAFVYSSWARHRWYTRIGLTVLAFALAYAFMVFLSLPLTEGILVDFRLGFGGI